MYHSMTLEALLLSLYQGNDQVPSYAQDRILPGEAFIVSGSQGAVCVHSYFLIV